MRTRRSRSYADDDFKLKQVTDILTGKLTKRGVDIRALKYGTIEKISGNKVKQAVTVRVGIEQELSKKIVKLDQGQQDEGAGVDPGRRRARVRREARRPAERDRARARSRSPISRSSSATSATRWASALTARCPRGERSAPSGGRARDSPYDRLRCCPRCAHSATGSARE